MPMSDLMLFGRMQDFGYAQADPLKVVESRHHFQNLEGSFYGGWSDRVGRRRDA